MVDKQAVDSAIQLEMAWQMTQAVLFGFVSRTLTMHLEPFSAQGAKANLESAKGTALDMPPPGVEFLESLPNTIREEVVRFVQGARSAHAAIVRAIRTANERASASSFLPGQGEGNPRPLESIASDSAAVDPETMTLVVQTTGAKGAPNPDLVKLKEQVQDILNRSPFQVYDLYANSILPLLIHSRGSPTKRPTEVLL